MALALFMMATDLTVLFLAQPAIAADLRPSAAQALGIVHVGEFLAASLVITMARFGDRFGRRRLVMLGAAGYGVASLVAALAPSAEQLLVARAVLGVSTAAVTPSALALLRVMFAEPRRFSRAFAVLMTAFSAGAALGPPMGGVLLEHFWWGSVFLINVPVAVLLLVAAPATLPASRDQGPVALDPASVGLSVLAVMAVVLGLQQAADGGLGGHHVLLVAGGVGCGVLFARRQRHLTRPLLDLDLLAPHRVRVALVTLFLVLLVLAGPDVLVGPHLQVGLGLSALHAGAVLFVPAVASVPATLLAPALGRRFGLARATALSLATVVLGYVVSVAALTGGTGGGAVVALVVGLSLAALAGTAMTLLSEFLVTSAPVRRAGDMTALQDVSGGLGAATGIAVLGTLGALVYRAALTPPPGLDPGVAAEVLHGPGAAVEVAAGLPASDRGALLDAVGGASTLGLQAALVTAVVLGTGLVVLSLTGLRDRTPGGRRG